MSKRTVLVLLALAAAAALCAAQDTSLALEKIVVTATRIAGTILASPDHITVVSGDELAGALSAAEALEGAAGVSVSENGTAGSVQSLSIRGSTAAQVLVLVDGIRLNDGRQGGADLSVLPVGNIERIEIVRGGSSALYGADAMGGVVNIITKDKAEDRFRLSLINGSYLPRDAVKVAEALPSAIEETVSASAMDLLDTQKLSAALSTELGQVDLVASGSFTRAANGFAWYDSQYVGDYRRRVNADLLGGDLTASLGLPLGEGRLRLRGQVSYQEIGAPGIISTNVDPDYGALFSTDAGQQQTLFQAALSYSTPRFLSQALTLDSKLFYKYSRLSYQNPDPLGALEVAVDDSHQLHTLGLEASQAQSALDFLRLVYGGNFLVENVFSTAIGEKSRISGGLFLESPFYLSSWLTLTPMLRYDLSSDFPGSLTYKLAAVASLSETISLKASAARSYRAPTLNDLFWPNDGFVAGNPDLRPESGYNAELGITALAEGLQLNFFAFVRYVQDGIQWAYTTIYQPVNIGEALYPGFEADLELTILKGLRISAGYTFLYSFVLNSSGTDYKLADEIRAGYAPIHSLDAGLVLEIGRTRAGIKAQYVGQRYSGVEGEFGTTSLDPYLVLNAQYRRAFSERWSITLEGRNLLNQVYQSLDGYPMPLLSFWVGAELTL
ncbi:MAG: hypothetical protein A2064_05080 [Spirochaetes bacterium GWB1_66_5]|nr:MAG: hypothetical protein A2064_05080 [Spirochaetes bacterium GWB1_66_5]